MITCFDITDCLARWLSTCTNCFLLLESDFQCVKILNQWFSALATHLSHLGYFLNVQAPLHRNYNLTGLMWTPGTSKVWKLPDGSNVQPRLRATDLSKAKWRFCSPNSGSKAASPNHSPSKKKLKENFGNIYLNLSKANSHIRNTNKNVEGVQTRWYEVNTERC